MDKPPNRKSLFRTWEWILLLAALLVLLYFLLDHFGLGVLEVTEDSQLIDRPHD